MLARYLSHLSAIVILTSCGGSGGLSRDAAATATAAHTTALAKPIVDANVVTVVATEYAFQAPSAVPAGLTTFQLVNHGHQLHMMGVTKLENGKSIPELLAVLTKNQPQPSWAVDFGGPNAVSPGDTSNSTSVLAAGHYAIICWIPAADGAMHVLKGMIAPLEVTAAGAAPAPEPLADIVIRLADYHIDLARPITSGRHTFRVENDGPHEHDVTVLDMASGKSAAEAMAWLSEPDTRTPAARAVGGIVGMPRGAHGFFTATFHPGRYLFLCFVPDERDGKPHFQHGMVQRVTVR